MGSATLLNEMWERGEDSKRKKRFIGRKLVKCYTRRRKGSIPDIVRGKPTIGKEVGGGRLPLT